MQKAHQAGNPSSAEAAAASHGGEPGVPFVVLDAPQALPETLHAAQALIESLPVPVFFKDREGNYLGVNKAWEEFFGIPREKFLGKRVQDLYPLSPEVADKHQAMDEELWQHPGRQSYEITVAAQGGQMRDTIYYKATLHGEDGGVAGLIGTIVDITERKQAESALRESEARFRLTFELAGSGIAHVGLDGRFLRVNRSLCAILGYSAEELAGRTVKDISHPDDRDVSDAERVRLRAGELESTRLQKRYLRKDGATVWVDLTVALVRDAEGNPLYEIAVFDDDTERKNAESALRQAHDELARSNAELEQFAYVASHDLQEPLRMVSSYTQLLLRRYGERFDGDAKEFMDYIVDGAARMKQLIEDLLAYSRVGTRGGRFRPVACEEVLGRVLVNLRAAIEASGATVTHDPLPTLQADDSQLAQLLQNLIGNALKFHGAGAPRVHVGALEHDAEWEFFVRDNSIGIEPQYYERIFMVFQRLHDKGEYPGTGIGLAICKKVVDRHGGRIWVESKPGEGSTFRFTLPKQRGENHE